jgi:pseudouridine synthase
VEVRPLRRDGRHTVLEIRMGEGRNRQIRRTAERLGHPVLDLQRLAIGPISLGRLEEGRWRRLAMTPLQDLSPREVPSSG